MSDNPIQLPKRDFYQEDPPDRYTREEDMIVKYTEKPMLNLVEVLADDQEPSPCIYGVIVETHACYCHHPEGPRKCPQWRNDEPYEECEYYKERE